MATHRKGAETADPGAEHVHRRHVPRATDRPRRRLSGIHGPIGQVFPEPLRRPEAAQRRVVPHHGHGPGPRCRRHDLRAGGQSPLSLGRVLRSGKPRAHEAHFPADVRGTVDPARGGLSEQLLKMLQYIAPSARAIRRSSSSRRAFTIRPISSTASSPGKWASTWFRAAIWS